MVPTVPSLEKICEAFGITLSQLFAGDDTPIVLTAKQKEMSDKQNNLSTFDAPNCGFHAFPIAVFDIFR